MANLERKLGGNAVKPTYIFNEPRLGYRMLKGEEPEHEEVCGREREAQVMETKKKRLTLDLEPTFQRRLKAIAALKGVSMRGTAKVQ